VDVWLHSDGFKWLFFSSESNSNSVTWKDKHLLFHAFEHDFSIHFSSNHWFILDGDGDLITEYETSLLVSFILMADVQVGVRNLILNFDSISNSSSSLLDVLSMVEAGGGTSKGGSLSILEVNLDFVISHTLEHLTGQFEETERFDISLVGIVEKFNGISFSWSTLSWISIQ
jgi:hypothetical protein